MFCRLHCIKIEKCTQESFTHISKRIITVQSRTPFILPLLTVTGSKIWFPPHNSPHNVISPALNCQDNLYQSRGESPGSLSVYSSAGQEKQGGGGIIDNFPRAKPPTSRRRRHWAVWVDVRWQKNKKSWRRMDRMENQSNPCSRGPLKTFILFFFLSGWVFECVRIVCALQNSLFQ